jgi:hypothetical protein
VGHARARKVAAQLVEDEDYQLRYERVAGIDVAKAKADVCTRLPPAREGGRRVSRVETVAATAREVLALAGRLIADGVEVVVMESTSDYWRIWYYLLESEGLNVQLVNSRHARQLAGRPKTDPLTELSDVSAAQVGRPSRWSITEMPGRSGLPGCCSPVASPTTTETGHTRRNLSPAFSSLPIFDVSRGGP